MYEISLAFTGQRKARIPGIAGFAFFSGTGFAAGG